MVSVAIVLTRKNGRFQRRSYRKSRSSLLSGLTLTHIFSVVLLLGMVSIFRAVSSSYYSTPFEWSPKDPRVLPTSCECIRCASDLGCGGMWNGEVLLNATSTGKFEKIAIVISHCLRPLDWVASFTAGRNIHSVTIISKCNQTIIGAPEGAKVIILPNVGRCDHSYAYWIRHNYRNSLFSPDVVIFLKDERTEENIHQAGVWTSFTEMLHTAHEQGFACGLRPTNIDRNGAVFHLSAYHDTAALGAFNKKEYSHHADIYVGHAKDPFPSIYPDLAAWSKAMRFPLPKDLMQACYGGTFAVAMTSIRAQEEGVWINLLESLSRGDNIEEGHFAERCWAGLLAIPPTPFEISQLRNYSCCVANYTDSYVGTLKKEGF